MADVSATFEHHKKPVPVRTGMLISEAAKVAGIDINQPCGGQGRCGRCVVKVESGNVHRRSTVRLTDEEIDSGYALACQTVIQSDVSILIPPQEVIERKLVSDRTVTDISPPSGYNVSILQNLRRIVMSIDPPSLEDQTDDLSRIKRSLRQVAGITYIDIPLQILRKMGGVLRSSNWQVCAYVDLHLNLDQEEEAWLVDITNFSFDDEVPIWGAAIDIGTTTVTVWLVDLISGKTKSQAAQYNGQIVRGEDVISRIIYAGKNGGLEELRRLVLDTINNLIKQACNQIKDFEVQPNDIYKVTVAGNSTMIHLLLGIQPTSIRLTPFITSLNQPPLFRAEEIGLEINPMGVIDCLPGVASYVGADISSGVYFSKIDHSDKLTLFLDVGTNGEIVFGSREWLVTCACSAGPAFEGAGVLHGMRATVGAIEDVWINSETYEPTYRVIGGVKPRGLCGSGLISLIAEMFITGVIDKGGNLKSSIACNRVREGKHGLEYVIAWSVETENSEDIVITHVDIDNLIRAKAAIYAGFSVLAQSVGVSLDETEEVIIGGSFGKYINLEKAIQIGLLPDLPWDRFHFLGNTSIKGAYLALLDRDAHNYILQIANKMTYIELSADNSFYESFISALFLPHTNLEKFPSVKAILKEAKLI